MASIERRVSALESKATGGGLTVILRTFCRPGADGPVACEPRGMRNAAGTWGIERMPDESREAFRERAVASAPRAPGQIACLREEL